MGQVVKWAFIIFNLLMLLWMITGLSAVGSAVGDTASDAERAGAAIGGTIGASLILFVWGLGDVILGMFVLFTRGKKIITEETTA